MKKIIGLLLAVVLCGAAIAMATSNVNQINNKCRNYGPNAYDNGDDRCVCEDGYFMQQQKTYETICVKSNDFNSCGEHGKLISTERKDNLVYDDCGCESGYLYRNIGGNRGCYTYNRICKVAYGEVSSYASGSSTGDVYKPDIACECPLGLVISEGKCMNKGEITKLNISIYNISNYGLQARYYYTDGIYYNTDIDFWGICDTKGLTGGTNAYIDLGSDHIISKNDTVIFPTNKVGCTILSSKEVKKFRGLRNITSPNGDLFGSLMSMNDKSIINNYKTKSSICTEKGGVWNVKKKTCKMRF